MKLSAGLALLTVITATPQIRYFRYQRPIAGLTQRSGQSCLVLDPEILRHAAPGLADLRLYRNSVETPYVVRTAAAVQNGEQRIAPLNLGRRGGQTVFDANLPPGPYSDLQLDVDAKNFIATVVVTGSQSSAGGDATRIGAYTIFDLTAQKLGRSTVLHLPASDFRFLHFRVRSPLAPESIQGLSVARLPESQPSYQTVAESLHFVQKGRTTVVEFTLPARLPVDRVAFTVGASPAQFSREVSVEVAAVPKTGDETEPAQIADFSGNLLRVHSVKDGQRIDEERLTMDALWVDSNAPSQWTVTIENGDDAPLDLESARLEILERSLCFDAAAQGSYTLFYGDPALAAPSYDYAEFFAPQSDAIRLQATPEEANPVFQPRPDQRPFTERHPALLWIVLIAVIALLGAVALRSAKSATPGKS